MKWFYKSIIVLLITFFAVASVRAQDFSDISGGYQYYQAITQLSDEGIVSGYPDGSFRPDTTINRAEVVKVLIEALYDRQTIDHSLDWHKERDHWYVMLYDVNMNDWFAPHVEVAYQNNIVRGYEDGTFRGEQPINFAEALKMILKSFNINTNTPFRHNPLLYVKQNDWFAPYFMTAEQLNLLNQNKFYHPAQLITRGEFAEIVYRLRMIQQNDWEVYRGELPPMSDDYRITIPRLNIINVPVGFADPYDEKGALQVLTGGMGQYLSPPDHGRKMVMFGHSSGYSWDHSPYKRLLRQINRIQTGDMIYINYKEKGYIYQVYDSEIIPASQDQQLMEDTEINELVLYTCWPPDRIDQRYVVYSRPIL